MARIARTRVEFQGEATDRNVVLLGPQPSLWPQEAALDVVGTSIQRVDGRQVVTGRARYSSDVRPPGMLYGRILRSPFPHARIVHIDASRAELLPGVRAVVTPNNIPAVQWRDGRMILGNLLTFVGDEVAAVAADDQETAEDALSLIDVRYEELPFVLDPEDALRPDAPRVHPMGNLVGGEPRVYRRGDLQAGWSEAEVSVDETFQTQASLPAPMETHGSVALWDGQDLTIWDSTQGVFAIRAEAAEVLGLPLNRVRIIAEHVGGAFGGKQQLGKHTILAAILSRMSGRPVQISLARWEESLAAGHRHATRQRIRLGARRDGTLTAMELYCIVPVGYHGRALPVEGPVQEVYRCPNVLTEVHAVRTNDGPAGPSRGSGHAEGSFALECAMDILAERLGMDPLDLRLKNYAERDPVTGREYSSKRLRDAYLLAAERIGWSSRNPRAGEAAEEAPLATRKRGIGMATQIWSGGGGPPAYAVVRLNPDGSTDVITGVQEVGSGVATALVQIAAEALGVPPSTVRVILGDTRDAPFGPTSASSQTLSSVGPAVRSAAEDVREQLLELAAPIMGTPKEKLHIRNGFVHSRNAPAKRRAIAELLGAFDGAMLIGLGSREPNPDGYALRTFGAQFAEVEVDQGTGRVHLLRLVAVHDCGRVINPALVESQMVGGIVQGIGYALTEERKIDPGTGRPLNPDLEEYLIPTSMDVPEIDARAVNQPDPHGNSLGANGISDAPIIPTAPAIANAVYNAIGVPVTRIPLEPSRAIGRRPIP